MANPKEGYLILIESVFNSIRDKYPHAIDVGNSHKLISYALTRENDILGMLSSSVQKLSADGTIYAMDNLDYDGYICYAADIHKVLDAFIEETVQ